MHTGIPGFSMPQDAATRTAADTFRLLADPTRIRILWALLQGETSVACLAELVGATPTAVSQHLAKLRAAGLVTGRRQGTFVYYSAADVHVRRMLEEAFSQADHDPDAPGEVCTHPTTAGARPPGGVTVATPAPRVPAGPRPRR